MAFCAGHTIWSQATYTVRRSVPLLTALNCRIHMSQPVTPHHTTPHHSAPPPFDHLVTRQRHALTLARSLSSWGAPDVPPYPLLFLHPLESINDLQFCFHLCTLCTTMHQSTLQVQIFAYPEGTRVIVWQCHDLQHRRRDRRFAREPICYSAQAWFKKKPTTPCHHTCTRKIPLPHAHAVVRCIVHDPLDRSAFAVWSSPPTVHDMS